MKTGAMNDSELHHERSCFTMLRFYDGFD